MDIHVTKRACENVNSDFSRSRREGPESLPPLIGSQVMANVSGLHQTTLRVANF